MSNILCMQSTGYHREAHAIGDLLRRHKIKYKRIYSAEIPPKNNCILIGSKFRIPKGRLIERDDRYLFNIPILGNTPPGAPETQARDAIYHACAIVIKVLSGKGLDLPCQYKEIELAEALARVNPTKINWFDIETTGLDPFKHLITCLAFCPDRSPVIYILHGRRECLEFIRFLVDRQIPVGVCNAVFESKWAEEQCGGLLNIAADVQVDHALLFEERQHGLKNIAGLVGAYGYDTEMENFLSPFGQREKKVNDDGKTVHVALKREHYQAPRSMMNKYVAGDVFVTYKSYNKMNDLIKQDPGNPEEVRSWMIRGQKMLAQVENRGMKVDRVQTMKQIRQTKEEIEEALTKIRKIAKKVGMADFNHKSSPQKSQLLYEKLGLPVLKLTNKMWIHPDEYVPKWWEKRKKGNRQPGSPSSDSEALKLLKVATQHPVIDEMINLSSKQAILDGILTRCMSACDEEGGFMRGSFSLTKLLTGQLSSTNPPMQNVPKDPLRRIFISRFKGGRIIECDYSQLHLRIIGNLAKCDRFIDCYTGENTVDLHTRTAARVICNTEEDAFKARLKKGSKKASENRDLAKRTNFSIIFEITGDGLALKLQKGVIEAKQIIDRWFDIYPEVKEQIDRQHRFAEKKGYVISPMGRVRHLPDAQSSEWYRKSRAFRQAGDYLISNSGRSICLYSMIMLNEELQQRGMKSVVDLQIHDSIRVDTHPDEIDDVTELFRICCIDRMTEMCADWMDPIPLVMDGTISRTWYSGDKEDDISL